MLKQTLRNPSHPQREWGLMREDAKALIYLDDGTIIYRNKQYRK